MNTVIDILPNPSFGLLSVILVVVLVYRRLAAADYAPPNVPWVGRNPKTYFSKTKAQLRSFGNIHEWLAEGYEKYAKQDKSYILPEFTGRAELLVPSSQVQWLVDQPDHILSASEFHYTVLEGDYAFTSPKVLADPYHERVIHKYLPRRMGAMIPIMWDEITSTLDKSWGMDTQSWKSIGVLDCMMDTIPRISNRVFVGTQLCRNNDYIANVSKFMMDVITSSMFFLQFTPQLFRPIVGRIVTIPNNYHFWRSTKYSLPLIKERLAQFKQKAEDPNFEWEEPNDYISWHISLATAENRMDELTPDMIARRLMPLNFAAIHTTAMTITNVFFDLVATDPSLQYLEEIRQEFVRVLAEEGGQWTKAGLGRCHRADSAIRESMRVSNFMTRNVMRKVMQDGGIENKAQGWWAPKGAFIGLDMHSVQHDPQIYPSPETYDAFRFSRPREENDSSTATLAHGKESSHSSETTKDNAEAPSVKPSSIVTTSPNFLPFGHGRHACPGRFLVSAEMKMILAYMVLNYEVEPLGSRPPNKWFGQNCIPPMKATIKVKRRVGTGTT